MVRSHPVYSTTKHTTQLPPYTHSHQVVEGRIVHLRPGESAAGELKVVGRIVAEQPANQTEKKKSEQEFTPAKPYLLL